MPETPVVEEAQAREYLKQAVADLVARKPEVLREVVAEVLEDMGMGRAIEEAQGEPDSGEKVSREEIYRILGSGAKT